MAIFRGPSLSTLAWLLGITILIIIFGLAFVLDVRPSD
jgi:hypothetical protein